MTQFRIHPQPAFNFSGLVIDNFAGGGGASTGIEMALGRPVDIAVNHDPEAVAMHDINHPHTRHYCESVWDIDPRTITQGRPVDLCWFSPDCKHFSKAKGGTPVSKKIRGLAWVTLRYAATVRPRVIMLENVEEFITWGPIGSDGRPCPRNKGRTFSSFVNALRRHGYQVEWRELRACDFGAPTIRKRLFLIARCDSQPIVWPEPTHGDPNSEAVKAKRLKPWRTAGDIIDWSLPCPSIFDRKRPLAEATMRRIARGIQRYVINSAAPFLVKVNHGYDYFRGQSLGDPLQTLTSKLGTGVVVPTLVQVGYGERHGQAPRAPGLAKPLGTVVAGGGKHALVAAFLAKHYGGNYTGPGAGLQEPTPTVTTVDHNALVTSHLVKLRNNQHSQAVTDPVPTITAGGGHVGEVRAFLLKYYGTGEGQTLTDPLHTVTTKDRHALVMIKGEPYQIVDIGMRMLEPHELYAAQGFPADYIHDHTAGGKKLSKAAQVRMCGNSVCPPVAAALVRANLVDVRIDGREAA
ncbi:DNA cytosine methyltransferase [Halopseudomonas phragmitis]|uniref:DNA (cytosine-5-)-methyltransferase n=1 Tax=Halopseudomonas phragmitis TaxID=1931241 RepID=A0A1V0AZZ3_9GAMM|nr:DNA cytosine methyltransferase [Halopseudomonas phragmitis]AQZ93253.1 type II restriction endonuclease subunit M [Halopseudomonas phragmitis]